MYNNSKNRGLIMPEETEETEKKEVTVQNESEESDFLSPIELKEDIFLQMEENRKKFDDSFKKTKRINLLIVCGFMAVIVLIIIFLRGNGAFLPVLIVLVALYFIVLSLYSKKTKEKLNAEASSTIRDYFAILDSYITQNEAFGEVKFNAERKLDETLFPSLKICKDIHHVGGRDVIRGTLFGDPFVAGDSLVKTNEKKEDGTMQEYIVFLGKLFVIEKKRPDLEGRIVIYLKGKGANGPTDIEDLTKCEGILSDKFDVYASENACDVLSAEMKETLESYERNDTLIDMFITIDKERTSFGFSYSDGVMKVPLFEPIPKEEILQFKSDVEKMVGFLSASGK